MTLCGGFSETVQADAKVKGFVAQFKKELEETIQRTGENLVIPDVDEHVEIVGYQSQVVAGTNYKIFLRVKSNKKTYEMVVFEALPCYGGDVSCTSVTEVPSS